MTFVFSKLNTILASISAVVVVSQVTMPSTSKLTVVLNLYFLDGCVACGARERKLIKKLFKKGLALQIYIEYYIDCILDPITVGTTSITLDDDISDSNGISAPKRSRCLKNQAGKRNEIVLAPINSLAEQSDPCPNRPALIYPTGESCIRNRDASFPY